ncbi:hypothetical protein [Paenarthrobacter sp. YJN-5]|uniref:hypothetical protein n=1 Tax=Paenarthrobacter sp. YJN-5 TaxID=2735316 RepID=UPI001877A37B|nr:hypothetical protein [Paenarthrobacter sp. YJN-5]QOT15368.1 hypothetical protein HMI59_01375 [Paenarthrobacter sp. YJN-5]
MKAQPAPPPGNLVKGSTSFQRQAGPATYLNQRGWHQIGSYKYEQRYPLIDIQEYSAAAITKVFREHPKEIFPFPVEGCATFTEGATCRLKSAHPVILFGDRDGTVRVNLKSETNVTFTVVSNDYFDAPGSTISFDIVQRGDVPVLTQTADAHGTNPIISLGINTTGQQWIPWFTQAAYLTSAVKKYGEK